MADVQQTYKFKFEFDRKDIKNQLKCISADVKDAISQIGDASDKVVIFKDLVSYLSNVDKALDAFKTKHKDDFNNLFGNPDKEILGVLTEIFNTTQQSAQAFATLKDKISAAESGKAGLSTLRGIAEEINALFVSINKTPKIDIDEMFSGKGSKAKGTDFAGRIKLLNDTLAEFGITYSGFQNKLKGGFGFGGSVGSSISKEMQKEIDALNKQKSELQEIIDAIDGKDIKINISVKDDAKQIKKLLEEYKKVNSKTISNEFKDLSLNEQNKLLAEQLRLATLLKNARDHINKKGGSNEAFDLVNTGEGLRVIDNIEKSLDGNRLEIQKKADQIKNIYADLIANIDVKLNQLSIDNLNMESTRQSITSAIELMQEANRIIGEISYDSQNFDLLDAQLDSIIDKIKQLATSEEQIEQLDELLEGNRDAPEDILDELCTILEVDIPRAAEKARDAIDGIAGGQNGPSKQNISILAKQLQEIYNISRQIGDNEIGFAVDIDGSAYFVQSADHIVKVADEASVAVRALNENLTILGHTHPSGGGLFSAGDYRSAISQKRSGMNMPVVAVGSNAASLLNLDGVDEEVLNQIEHVLDRFKDSDDAVGFNVVKELQNILSTNGFTDALQIVDISNGMDGLSEALLKLSLNAREVQTPLQKLQSLIQYYSGNKLGTNNIFQFADEWKEFESGAKSAAEVFDSVMYKLDATDLEGNFFNTSEKEYKNLSTSLNAIGSEAINATTKMNSAENEIQSFLALTKEIQGYGLLEFFDARDNVTIGKYTERLEVAKNRLDELGAQGLITADELKQVEEAYNISKSRLELQTSNYSGYGSGDYDYTYYDDYREEKSKNEDLENELTRKEERIAELESDLRASDDALQETLGNKYALIAESRTLEIEKAKLLLQKQNLEYEDILALMQSYQNLQTKAKEAFDYGDEKAMYDMQEIAGQIYDRVVPQNLDDFTEPDRWFKAVGVSAEEGAQKLLEFRERLDAVRSSHDDLELSDSEDIEDLQRENGALEDKLEILREIAYTYGVQITKKDRNRYEELNTKEMEDGLTSREEDRMSELSEKIDEADSNLLEFEQTYDRITLKLSNGKKVEILPDDDGLRKLYKIADSYDNEYNGFDIEDVIFERKQENAVIEATNSALQEQLNIEKQISDEKQQSTNKDTALYDSMDGQLAFFDNILQGAQRAEEQVEKLEDTMERAYALDNQTSMFDVDNISYEQPNIVDESQEIAQLEVLKTKLLEVKTAVDAKTQAFEEEYVTVDGVVEAEIAALQELSNKLDGIITKVGLVEASLKNIGNNSIQLNVSDSEEQLASLLTSSDITREITELDRLQKQVIGVKDAVLSKTKAFVDEGNVVGQVVGKEISGLIRLEGIVNNISKKISELVQNITALNQRGINFNQNTDVLDVTTRTPEEQFKIDKTAQKGALTKYLDSLKDVDYVVGDLRKKLNDLPELLDIAATPDNLNKFKEIFADIKKEVDATRRGFEEREGRGISSRKNALYTSFNALDVEQQKELKDDFDVAINKLQEYEAQIKAGKRVELDALEAAIKGIREKIEAQKELNKAAKDAEKTQKKNSTFGDTAMINAKAKYNTLDQVVHSRFKNSPTAIEAWDKYEESYRELENLRDQLSKKKDITSDDEAKFKAAKDECNDYAKALNRLINNSDKLHAGKANKEDYILGSDFNYDDEDVRKAELEEFVKTIDGANLASIQFKKGFKEAMFEVKNGDGTITKMTAKFTEARNEIIAMAGDAKKVKGVFSGFIDGVLTRIKSLSQFFIATISVYDVWNVIKKGIGYVKEIDGALVELRKVTNETEASYKQFLQTMSQTAGSVGSTVKDLTSSAADWAKLGYSMQEAGELAATTAKLLNVSEFSSVDEATSALVSSLQAFTEEGQDVGKRAEEIVDILNNIGNKYPVATNELADGLATSSAALVAANNSIEEQVALLSAGNATMQDISTVAAGLKIVAARLRGTTTDIDDEADSAVTNVSKLQAKIKALTAEANGGEGINIINEDGSYKSTYEILTEISKIFDKMDDVSSAALLELIAGKNRSSVIAAVLQNGDILEEAYADAFDSASSAQKELDTYLQSIQGRIDLFNNTVQTMWMNLLDTSWVKGIVDAGTGLIKFLDSGAGRFAALTAAIAGAGKALKIIPAFKIVNDQLQILGKTTDTISNNFKQLSSESTNIFGKIGAAFKSVFGADVGIDLTSMLSEDEFNTKLNTYITGFNNLDQSVKKISWKDYVAGLSNVDGATKKALETCTNHNGQIIANTEAYKTYTGAAVGAAVGNQAVDGSVKKITASLIAQKVAALAANAALTMGISLVISLAVKAVTALANADEAAAEAARSAVDASKEIRDQADSLEDYKDQIRELRTELDSNTLSETEAYDTRKQLLTIQDELINKYGLEKDGINLVTGAIEDQIAAINELSKAEANQWLQNKQSTINDAIEYFASDTQGGSLDKWYEGFGNTAINMWGQSEDVVGMVTKYALDHNNIDASLAGIMGDQTISFTGSVEEVKTAVEDFQVFLAGKEEEMQTELTNLLKIDDPDNETQKKIDSLTASLKDLQDVREDLGKEHENWFGENSTYAANKKLLDELKYNTAITKYDAQYGNILAAQNAYKDAQASGDIEASEEAIKQIKENAEIAIKAATDNGQWYMVDYFNNFLDDIFEEEYEVKIRANEDGLKDQLTGIIKESGERGLSALDDNQIKDLAKKYKNGQFNIDNDKYEIGQFKKVDYLGYTKDQVDGIAALSKQAIDAGISLETLINILVKLGLIDSRPVEELAEEIYSISDAISDLDVIQESFGKLGEAFEDFRDNGIVTAETLAEIQEVFGNFDGFDKYAAVLGDSSSSMDDVKTALSGLATAYLENHDILSNLTEENEAFITSQLKAFGVINAEEYVAGMKAIHDAIDAKAEAYNIDLSNYATVEAMKTAIAEKFGVDVSNIEGDTVNELATRYGVDLSNYKNVELAKTRVAIEQAKIRALADKQQTISNSAQVNTANRDSQVFNSTSTTNTQMATAIGGKTFAEIRDAYFDGKYDGQSWAGDVKNWLSTSSRPSEQLQTKAVIDATNEYNKRIAELNAAADMIDSLNRAAVDYYQPLSVDASKLSGPDDKSKSGSDSANEFKETLDWVEIRLEEINEQIDLMNAKLENAGSHYAKNNIIDDIIGYDKTKMANLLAGIQKYSEYAAKLLAKVPAQYRDAAENGAIAISEFAGEADEKTVEAIENYREWAQKVADLRQQLEEVNAEIRELAIQKIDNIKSEVDARNGREDLQTEKLQSMVDLDEAKGLITSDAYYKAMMENSNKKIEYWTKKDSYGYSPFERMQKELNEAVKNGTIEVESVEWYEQIAKLYEVQAEINAATIELEEFQNAINQIKWDNFDQLINRLDYLRDETQSLIDLMDSDDMVITPETEDGWNADQVEWTEEGLASLGLYAQQMEIAEYQSKQYAEAIDDLTKDYKKGLYSENEYIEKLNELKSAQYDSIEAYYDAQDAIKDLQKARVDEIKNGIEKQVDAYEKLINKKKEALSAEKDLHDFQKQSAEQSKNIAQIERQLAALANDHSMAAMAKKRQLEAELAEAKAEQEELYYDRSIENQQTALDKELDSFKEQKDAEIQKWDEYLENVENLVAESLGIVQENAAGIGQILTDKANEYNLTVSDAITTPWKDGSLAVSDYQTTFDTAMSSTMDQLEALKASWQSVIDKMIEAGNTSVNLANKQNAEYAAAKKQEVTSEPVQDPPKQDQQKDPDPEPTNARSEKDYYGVALAIWQDSAYYGWGRGKTGDNNLKSKGFDPYKVQEIINKIGEDGYIKNGTWRGKYYGIRDLTPYHINKFAKGTNSASKNQLAIIDELGEELQLVPGQNGRLEYIKKGTGIVPADLTKRLVDMAMDPQSMLDRNRPVIGAPHIINNEINIDCSVGEMVHIEHCDQNTLPDVEKLVNKAFDKHMQTLNNSIRRFTR